MRTRILEPLEDLQAAVVGERSQRSLHRHIAILLNTDYNVKHA
jgi:hypothetical protein